FPKRVKLTIWYFTASLQFVEFMRLRGKPRGVEMDNPQSRREQRQGRRAFQSETGVGRGDFASGTANAKVEPSPGALETVMLPPRPSTTRFTVASPSPRP